MATTVATSTHDLVAQCMAIASDMMRLPTRHMWVDYDQEADVLYMSFHKPQNATRTLEVSEDVLVRKDGRNIVGLTIMNASSKRRQSKSNSHTQK